MMHLKELSRYRKRTPEMTRSRMTITLKCDCGKVFDMDFASFLVKDPQHCPRCPVYATKKEPTDQLRVLLRPEHLKWYSRQKMAAAIARYRADGQKPKPWDDLSVKPCQKTITVPAVHAAWVREQAQQTESISTIIRQIIDYATTTPSN